VPAPDPAVELLAALPERAWGIAIVLTMRMRELLCQRERLLPAGEAMCALVARGKAIRA
jgi:hypothetical protein